LRVEKLWQSEAELVKEGFLLWQEFGDAAKPNLAKVGSEKNNVGAWQGGEQGESPMWLQRLGGSAGPMVGEDRSADASVNVSG